MDLFRRWIRREHTIWKAAREAHLEFRKRFPILPFAAAGGLLLAGLLAVGWFALVPRFFPSLRGSAPKPAAETTAATEMKDITFTANRGPWRLNIDGTSPLTNEGQRDQVSIRVARLAPGRHIVLATPREGNPVSTEIDVTGDGQVFKITFEPVSKPSAKTTVPAAVVAPPVTSPAAVPKATATPGPVASGGTPAAPEEQQAQPAREGSLFITTKPADAAVTLDGQPTGKRTPFVVDIAPGEHVVVLTHEGYAEARVPVTVSPGEQARPNEIVLVDAWAEITFNVRPTAQIFIDNVHVLDTPYAKPFAVRAGTHIVTIKNEALSVDESMTVTLVQGESRTIEKVLK